MGNKQKNIDSEYIRRATQREWGDCDVFTDWNDGVLIRCFLIEAMWRSTIEQVLTCLCAAATIGERENVSQIMVGEIFKITNYLEG